MAGFLGDLEEGLRNAVGATVAAPFAGPLPAAYGIYKGFSDGQGGGGAPSGGGGGGGGGHQPGGWDPAHHPVHAAIDYIRSQAPGTDRHTARKLLGQYQIDQAQPGLADFVRTQTGAPDPNAMQMFFQQTVAPYLKQTQAQYQEGAKAGTAAMQHILAGAAPSPAIDVLKSYLPLQQAGAQKMGAAMEAATVTAPYYDQLLQQLQSNIKEQEQAQFYSRQAAAAGGVGATSGPSFGQQVAAGTAGKV